MIDLYYWPTPNGHKITLFLEEAGLGYTIKPVNISAGDQFDPKFLAFSPCRDPSWPENFAILSAKAIKLENIEWTNSHVKWLFLNA
jgi:Glutathione S-transferase, N-terminal domain